VVLPLTRPPTHTHTPGWLSLARRPRHPNPTNRHDPIRRDFFSPHRPSSLFVAFWSPLSRCRLIDAHFSLPRTTILCPLSLQSPSTSTVIETTPSFFVCFRICSFVQTMLRFDTCGEVPTRRASSVMVCTAFVLESSFHRCECWWRTEDVQTPPPSLNAFLVHPLLLRCVQFEG
jgi:hypothetical protein